METIDVFINCDDEFRTNFSKNSMTYKRFNPVYLFSDNEFKLAYKTFLHKITFRLWVHLEYRDDVENSLGLAVAQSIKDEYNFINLQFITRKTIITELQGYKVFYMYNTQSFNWSNYDFSLIPQNKPNNEFTSNVVQRNDSKNEYIFISHSSDDEKIVTSFFDNLLRLGLDISQKNLFYSSNPSTGISLGEDIPDALKEALNKMTIFIQYVSKSYKKSEVCLNEMGAAWVRLPKNKILTLKAPDVKFKELGFLNIQRLALSINKKEDLLKISENYQNIFDFSSTDYALKVDKFLDDNGFL